MYDYTNFNINMEQFVNDNDIKSNTNFLITTSLNNKMTYIFKKNVNNKWSLLYDWSCSIGTKEEPTITGVFKSKAKIPFIGPAKGYMAKWCTQIQGNYLYHSIIYNKTGEYVIDGRLGVAISHGCIRLATENAKWMYDKIPYNTTIIIK